jgi:hypothetical protein
MDNLPIALCDELIEERLLQTLAWGTVLPYAELKIRVAAGADDRAFRRELDQLLARGLVRRKPAHEILWYLGYARAEPGDQLAGLDDMPGPYRSLLSELMW